MKHHFDKLQRKQPCSPTCRDANTWVQKFRVFRRVLIPIQNISIQHYDTHAPHCSLTSSLDVMRNQEVVPKRATLQSTLTFFRFLVTHLALGGNGCTRRSLLWTQRRVHVVVSIATLQMIQTFMTDDHKHQSSSRSRSRSRKSRLRSSKRLRLYNCTASDLKCHFCGGNNI